MTICRRIGQRKTIGTAAGVAVVLLFLRFYVKPTQEVVFSNDFTTARKSSSGSCLNCSLHEDRQETSGAVDFRIIILTYNRAKSLEKLLLSLNDLELDGDRAVIDIFIDRSKKGNQVDENTLQTASSFHWTKGGQVRVHVQPSHAGIIGQWLDSWKATEGEVALILEDDLSISPFAYRWLKAGHRFYADRRDLVGVTLQSEGLIIATSGSTFHPRASDGVAYLYALVGSWGFSPVASHWTRFRRWFHDRQTDATYRPYVKGLVMTRWYKGFESRKREDTMWTMWFIAFCDQEKLFTLYCNLNAFERTSRNCLAVNRREPGLHFSGRGINNTGSLLRKWNDSYVHFRRTDIVKYEFSGKPVQTSGDQLH